MAAPAIQSYATGSSVTTSLVVDCPSGTQVGDTLLTLGTSGSSRHLTPPDGWTAVTSNEDGANSIYTWKKQAASGDLGGSFTFTVSSSSGAARGTIFRITGDDYTKMNGTNKSGSAKSVVFADVTAPTNESLVLWCVHDGSATTASTPDGTSSAFEQGDQHVFSQSASAGAVSGVTTTLGSWAAYSAVSLAIGVAAAGSPMYAYAQQ